MVTQGSLHLGLSIPITLLSVDLHEYIPYHKAAGAPCHFHLGRFNSKNGNTDNLNVVIPMGDESDEYNKLFGFEQLSYL